MPVADNRLPPHPSQIIDRSRPVTFQYNGRTIRGYQGDTLATALYASGVRIFNRSFKYHRPRGLLCVSGRCPNCMMNVDGTPNVRACTRAATSGAEIRHQNAWPSLEHDALSIFEKFDRLMPVGFYYKTLIKPKASWHLAEPIIRKIAGLGAVDTGSVSDNDYEHVNSFADVTVVGGGPAGCSAALAAAEQGLRVTLIDDQPALGGHLRWETRAPFHDGEYAGLPGFQVADKLSEAVNNAPNLTVLSGATAFGLYEGKLLGVHQGRELVKLRTNQLVVATGGQQVPSVFPQNDLPGVLLSTAALRLANMYGVSPGDRGVVITDNDQGLAAALELVGAGVAIEAVADSRSSGSALTEELHSGGVKVLLSHTIRQAEGKKGVKAAVLTELRDGLVVDDGQRIPADFICLATGYDPATALLHQGDCELTYDPEIGETVPGKLAEGIHVAGEVTGVHDPVVGTLQGRLAGLKAASAEVGDLEKQTAEAERSYRERASVGQTPAAAASSKKKFVCICEDVTDKDVQDGIAEGFDDVQTLKRYSTVSMGPCQGKMCHKSFVEAIAGSTGRSIAEIGGTTPRPPIQPVPMGAIAGPSHMPSRFTSIHHRHIEMGGRMAEVGEWTRPHSYGSPTDEVMAVRNRVGIIDVSTLGKLDVRGVDAPRLMDKVYTHNFSSLRVGRIRYGMICSDTGAILDDGTVTRISEEDYYVTTGSGNIDLVEEWFRWWAAGTGMCVHMTNVTPGLGAINVAGPRARDTLSKLTDVGLSTEGFKYMRSARGKVAGVDCLLLRIGFVGETGWEVHFPAEYGEHIWDALLEAGTEFGIAPFGVEAQRILRLEKKHLIPGQDTDIMSNPIEADMAWAVRFEKEDFIGRNALAGVRDRGLRDKLVGFVMENGAAPQDGTPVLRDGLPVGKVTSARFSPSVGRSFGLAWVPVDLSEEGDEIQIRVGGQAAPARVTLEPVYDPEGKRLRE